MLSWDLFPAYFAYVLLLFCSSRNGFSLFNVYLTAQETAQVFTRCECSLKIMCDDELLDAFGPNVLLTV